MRVRFQIGDVADPHEAAGRVVAALRAIKAWDERKVRRHPRGTKRGGQFAPKAGGAEPVVLTASAGARDARQAPPVGGRDYYRPEQERHFPSLHDLTQATWFGMGRGGTPSRSISRVWKIVTPDGRVWFGKRMWRKRRQAFQEEMAWRLGKALGLPVLPAINYDVRQVLGDDEQKPLGLRVVDPRRWLSEWLTLSPFVSAVEAQEARVTPDPTRPTRLSDLDGPTLRWALGGGSADADPYAPDNMEGLVKRVQRGKPISVYRATTQGEIYESDYVSTSEAYARAYGERHLAGEPWTVVERKVWPRDLVVSTVHEMRYLPWESLSPEERAQAAQISRSPRGSEAALARLSTDMRIRLWLFDFLIANTDRHSGNWMIEGGVVPVDSAEADARVILMDHGFSFGLGDYSRLRDKNEFFIHQDERFNQDTPLDNRYLRWLEAGLAEVDPDIDRLSVAYAEEATDYDRPFAEEFKRKAQQQFRATLTGQMQKLRDAFARTGQGLEQRTTLGALWRELGLA